MLSGVVSQCYDDDVEPEVRLLPAQTGASTYDMTQQAPQGGDGGMLLEERVQCHARGGISSVQCLASRRRE